MTHPGPSDPLERARYNMIEQQVRTWDVLDERVLEAMRHTPRERFVPERFRDHAFTEMAIPLLAGEHMMTPMQEGRTLQALNLLPEDEVLEIGTGSGFLAACMAALCRGVTTVERHPQLAQDAGLHLQLASVHGVQVEVGDASTPIPALAREYDAIVLSGGVSRRPDALLQPLRPGGRLLAFIGTAPIWRAHLFTRASAQGLAQEVLFETQIDPLHGF